MQDNLAEINATADEALTGVRIVKSFAREPYEVARYGDRVEQLYQTSMERVKVRGSWARSSASGVFGIARRSRRGSVVHGWSPAN